MLRVSTAAEYEHFILPAPHSLRPFRFPFPAVSEASSSSRRGACAENPGCATGFPGSGAAMNRGKDAASGNSPAASDKRGPLWAQHQQATPSPLTGKAGKGKGMKHQVGRAIEAVKGVMATAEAALSQDERETFFHAVERIAGEKLMDIFNERMRALDTEHKRLTAESDRLANGKRSC